MLSRPVFLLTHKTTNLNIPFPYLCAQTAQIACQTGATSRLPLVLTLILLPLMNSLMFLYLRSA